MGALPFEETDKMTLTSPTVHHHMSNSRRHGEDVTEWAYQNRDDPAMRVSVWLSIQMSAANHFQTKVIYPQSQKSHPFSRPWAYLRWR